MSLMSNWCTLVEAESKFGIPQSEIMKWVEEGIVRAEEEKGRIVRVNMDDLELKVEEITKM